jgi:hypothetical protein
MNGGRASCNSLVGNRCVASGYHNTPANLPEERKRILPSNGKPCYTVRSKSRCALKLRYVDLVVSTEVAVEVCCCLTVFSW